MKFVSIWKPDPRAQTPGPPTAQAMDQMNALIGEMMSAGVLLDTGGVMNGGTSMRVRRDGSKTTVIDGPFTETKEVIGGYAVMQTRTRDELLSWTRRFLDCAGDGEAEIHELFELPAR